ncbi:hypothetical protein [Bacillus altitudinis]|uniref:hypothetical protein n=1 Tax=Bacillus altitudinis TaxID=293387 RepID=UPI001C3EEABF|nr:hypothetical protein [Bacillus altitudinis]QXJ48309.1 hypothetical protein KIV12_00410 [Bacillus altitudinis]
MDIRIQHKEDSAAAPIIKEIALHLLKEAEGKDVALRDIKNFVIEATGKIFSSGSYSGAMRDLIEESRGRVINSDRGLYRYESNIKKREINDAIENLIRSLDDIATDNILKISDEDLDMIRNIPRIQHMLNELKIK